MSAPRRPFSTPVTSADLTVVTVTHNSAGRLPDLLASAAEHLSGCRVVVVDSGSSDETVRLARGCEGVTTIALTENVGFGRANNRGLAEVATPATALLNPDVQLLDDSLLALAAEAVRDDRPARLLAPVVLSADGSRQDTVHGLPAAAADLIRTVVAPSLVPERLGGVALAPWRSRTPRRVSWAVGCALVARTATLRALGPFDERIFLYGEDMELGLRAAQQGIDTWFWPAARVLHHRAHTSHETFGGEPFARLARARHEVVAQRLGQRRAALDDAAQALTFASRIAVKAGLRRSAVRERRQLAALRAARHAAAPR